MTPRSLVNAATTVAVALLVASFGGCGLDASGLLEEAPGRPCVNAAQCFRGDDPCSVGRCGASGICEVAPAPDGEAPAQIAGDCGKSFCEAGLLRIEPDAADILDDHVECTNDTCVDGEPRNTAKLEGTACAAGDAAGTCDQFAQCVVQCGAERPACDDGNPCTTDTCDVAASHCIFTPIDGTPLPDGEQTSGDCLARICVNGLAMSIAFDADAPTAVAGDCMTASCAAGAVVSAVDPLDVPNDDDPCTTDECMGGVPMHSSLPAGSPCGSLFCNATGQCVDCIDPTQCGTDTDCKVYTCMSQICGVTYAVAGTPLPDSAQTVHDCKIQVCNGNGGTVALLDALDVPDDGNQCTQDLCAEGVPGHAPEPALTLCDNGYCNGANACVNCVTDAQCSGFETCGGGGVPSSCGCAPTTCAAQGKDCEMIDDGCGGMIYCGICIGFETCGGAGNANECGCTPLPDPCGAQGKNCGMIAGGCGPVSCGTCAAPKTCGGSGVMNVCGCTPNNPCLGKDCGMATDTCGGIVICSPDPCPGGLTCGGGGDPNVCG